jgi:CubicO group peptidase (beta-lactamase class C family)
MPRAGAFNILVIIALIGACSTTGVSTSHVQADCNAIWQRPGGGFYESNPTYTDSGFDPSDWDGPNPGDHHLDTARIDQGVDDLAKSATLQSVAIVRHGKLTYERYVNGGGADKSNNIHSASKSMLQGLLAIAVAMGFIRSLDDNVSRYLPAYPHADQITLRNLIEMKAGLRWTEGSSEFTVETQRDWTGSILDQELTSPPGTQFNYSSGNTQVLSAVLQAATGMSTCQFAGANLFGPLGITIEHWGRDPNGIYSGGYNLYMTTREMARFGLLYLNNGVYDSRQVVPEQAVTAARTPTSRDDSSTSFYSEGWWTRSIASHDMYFAWGYGGQYIYVMPSLDAVLVVTQRTDLEDRSIDSGKFIEEYVIPAVVDS